MQKIVSMSAVLSLLSGGCMAVNLSTTGLGQVALIPYYTVQAGNETLISITNTTEHVKAIKINYREAQNGRVVLGFNIYLSPYDVWVAKIIDPNDVAGAKLITPDSTCTVPAIPVDGVRLRSFEFANQELTREGYIEVLEMGVIADDTPPAVAATHNSSGVPNNCSLLTQYWNPQDGVWTIDPQTSMLPPAAGLTAEANIINVRNGVEYSESITMLDNFISGRSSIHSGPGFASPTLSSAYPAVSKVITSDNDVLVDEWETGVDAVSATMMTAHLINSYSINHFVSAETSWVVTFPTKHFYIDLSPVGRPFTASFDHQYGACERVRGTYWNREEVTPPVFHPQLPPAWALCWEANVIDFVSTDVNSDIFGAEWAAATFDLPSDDYRSGWAAIELDADTDHSMTSNIGPYGIHTYSGLPAIGFAATRLNNSNVGVGAAYAATSPHRHLVDIVTIVVD